MSYITHVLVQGAPKDRMEALNAWLREADIERHQEFRQINIEDVAGGTKFYVIDVWAAAFNYGPMVDLLSKLRDPETWGDALLSVAVIIDGEEESEAFVFAKVEGRYQPVIRQDWSAALELGSPPLWRPSRCGGDTFAASGPESG